MLCGMAKMLSTLCPPNTGKDEKESQQKKKREKKTSFPFLFPSPLKMYFVTTVSNSQMEIEEGMGVRVCGSWDAPG